MSTNFYFNNFPAGQITSEQLLVEDLVIEAMQIKGMDVFYLPRSSAANNEIDYLYGEDTLKQYVNAYPVEMYMENVTGMDGEGDFISKFGLEIRDELTMLVSRRRFKFATAGFNPILIRPREGDLVYIPLVQNFFEITFVEHENDQAMFHTLGRGRGGNVYVYALKMKQYVFSNEIIETGVEQVDEQIFNLYPKTEITFQYGSGTYIENEIVYNGTDLANAAGQAILFSADLTSNPKTAQLIRVQGDFQTSPRVVKGLESGASYAVNAYSDLTTTDDVFSDIVDNNRVETEADSILDWTERNPFGEA
jgi:hypothetical protein